VLHRAAVEQHGIAGDERPPRRQELVDVLGGRSVEHESERTLVAVLQHEHDRPVEVGIRQRGGGEEELSLQWDHAAIMPTPRAGADGGKTGRRRHVVVRPGARRPRLA